MNIGKLCLTSQKTSKKHQISYQKIERKRTFGKGKKKF